MRWTINTIAACNTAHLYVKLENLSINKICIFDNFDSMLDLIAGVKNQYKWKVYSRKKIEKNEKQNNIKQSTYKQTKQTNTYTQQMNDMHI